MNNPRRAKRRDANEKDIIASLRGEGYLVQPDDWVDLVIQSKRGRIVLMEVKTETGRLTKLQKTLLDSGWMVHVVRSPIEALAIVREADETA